MGPTASGKTALAEAVADSLGGDLVNADAFQIYTGMDVGTAKPRDKDRYALLDLRTPDQAFGLGEWLSLAMPLLKRSYEQSRPVIVTGGTGLYIRALFEEYARLQGSPDPELRRSLAETQIETLRSRLVAEYPLEAERVDLANPVRVRRALERLLAPRPIEPVELPPFRKLKLGLEVPSDQLEGRISRRVEEMMQNGWPEEVSTLKGMGYRREDPGFRAIGYRNLWDHLDRKKTQSQFFEETVLETRRYAKRQRTWLRSEPGLEWIQAENQKEAIRTAMERIAVVLR